MRRHAVARQAADVDQLPASQQAKRLPPVAQAFKNFLLQDGAELIDRALGVKPQAARRTARPAR